MPICLPSGVEFIINKLEENNYEAYAVGGCIRDSYLGRTPDDWDITTSAKPEEIKAIFDKTIDTGIQHGTVKVMLDRDGYEVTTYRVDGEYSDGRHPDNVVFISCLRQDLERRDFTINAMAYNPRTGLVDEFNGMKDLENGIIRCVGNSEERFNEDALRILRAVRFGAQLGFCIEADTVSGIKKLAENLNKISAERIQVELVKLLVSDNPERIRQLYEYGITKVIMPEFDVMMETPQNTKHHAYTVGEHTIKVLENTPKDKVLRLTALFHDVAKPVTRTTDEHGNDHFYNHPAVGEKMTEDYLRKLKFDNDTINKVVKLIKWHDYRPNPDIKSMRRALNKIGKESFPDLLIIKKADILAQSMYCREEKLRILEDYEKLLNEICEKDQCICIKDLAVSGKDLLENGYSPGVKIGEMLNELLDIVLEEPKKNTKEYLMNYVKEQNK